jgi:hypothetical protein
MRGWAFIPGFAIWVAPAQSTANAKSFEIIIVDDEVCRRNFGKIIQRISFLR